MDFGWGSLLINAASTGLSFLSHRAEARADMARASLQADMADRNAQIADMQGEQTLNVGTMAENRERLQTDQSVSSDRAALAAQGVDVSSGSAAAVTASQQLVGDVDALQIRDNAARQAWGFDVEASNDRMNARLALLGGRNEAAAQTVAGVTTLLTGAMNAYSINHSLRAPKIGTAPTPKPSQTYSGDVPGANG